MLVEKRWWTSASADSNRRVVQVAVVGAELVGEEHALVDDRPARHRDDVEVVLEAAVGGEDARRDDLADDVELALEGLLVGDAGAAADEDLAVERLGDRDLGRLATGEELSTGTSRQPRSIWPSSAMTSSTIASISARSAASCGMKMWPTA